MAINNDLMNTQTGGEGETVQIQTQEQVTPEQFDVNIKAQETPIDSEQVTETVTEEPIEPPLQREGMVEVQGVNQPSALEEQQVFEEEPPSLPESEQAIAPSVIVDDDPDYYPFQPSSQIEEDEYYYPYISPSQNLKNQFEETKSTVDQDLVNSGLQSVIDIHTENEEKGNGIFGKINKLFKKKEKEVSDIYEGDEIPDEELSKLGYNLNIIKAPTIDPSKKLDEQPLTKEEEDYTDVIDKESVIGQLNELIAQREENKQKLKTAQGEELKSIRTQLKSIRKNINDLKKSDDIKDEEEEYKQKALEKGVLPANYYNRNISSISETPIAELRTKKQFVVKNPVGRDKSDAIFADRIKDGMNPEAANTILYRLFVRPSEKDYWGGDASAKVKDVVRGGDGRGELVNQALTYEELLNIDRTFRSVANWAQQNGGKEKDKWKAALFPAFGNLPETTVEVKDKNGKVRTITLFSDIYDTPEQKDLVKNGYGVKESFAGGKGIDVTSSKRDYFVPESMITGWEKTLGGKGFQRNVFKQQQRLARLKDPSGKPYLQSEKGMFGVGVTGFIDKETIDAQKRLNRDIDLERTRANKKSVFKGDVTLKGESDFGPKEVAQFKTVDEWKNSGLTYGKYNVKNIPVELMRNTGDALAWAKNHLPTAKEIEFNNPNIFAQKQGDFKKYIDGLGLKGVSVNPLGAWYVGDLDYVRLDGNGKSLIIDLNESDERKYDDQLKRLTDWVKVAQDDPQSDFIRDYTASFDKDTFISKAITEKTALGEEFTISFQNQAGDKIKVTNKGGQLKAQDYLNELEFQQARLGELKANLDEDIKGYNKQIQPVIVKFKSIRDESDKSISILEKELSDLDYRFQNNKIDDEEFTKKTEEINNKMIAIQDNFMNSYNEMQNTLGGNKELLAEFNKNYQDLETVSSKIKIAADENKDLAAIEMARLMSDNQGPRTYFGHLVGAYTSGYMKPFIATISAASDALVQLGFYPEGMTKEEAFKQNNEWKTEFLYGTFTDALEESLGMKMSEGYKSRLGEVEQAVYGAVESVATQANPLVRATRGTPLQGVSSMLGYASQAYTEIEKEILRNPDLKDIPEYQRKIMTIPYAMAAAALDKFAYGKITKGQSSVTQKLMVSVVNQALKKLPKNATLEQIEAVIKGDIKSNIGKFIASTHRGAMVGFETEGLEAAAFDIGLKELWDNTTGHDAFNKGSTLEDYVKLTFDQAKAGYIGDAFLGGTMRVVEFMGTGQINMINPQDYDFFKLAAEDPQLKQTYANLVANDFISGDIDKKKAEKRMLDFENLVALDKKVSDEIEGDDRLKMVKLMIEKQALQERLKELDDTQKSLPNYKMEKIDQQIGEIVESTKQKIELKQEYDQKDEQGVSSEFGEGQEPVTTEPIEGPSDQEVSPGGMVQEEQTEITPTEEVTTETQITPTEPEKITSVMTTGETQLESDLIGKDVSTGKQLKTADIQTGEVTSEFREDKNPTKGKVVNVEADPRNKNIERLILEDGTVLNRNKNTGAISLNKKVKASTIETEVKGEATVTNEFDELADINKMTSIKKKKEAMKAFNEKYGDKATRISEIDSKFTSIVSNLETKGIIIKKC
jgi:hypothetical protein